MSDDDYIITPEAPAPPPIPFARPRRRWLGGRRLPRPARPRVRKLRLLLILTGLGALAAVSTVFGMMMAIASDLPQLENYRQYKDDKSNSYLYDYQNRPIGIFAPPENVVLDQFQEISPYMRRAIVSVEDRRFWSESGVDLRGLARAFVSDVSGGPTQGASTIAEQFVKNALAQQGNRTILEKLREAVLAYHLAHKWKPTKILREYLNSIYFGHGAYGVESAARVYFGQALGFNENATPAQGTNSCGDPNQADPNLPKCASKLQPWQAALLAGMVANPTEFDPITQPAAAIGRRNLVLRDMYQQHYITRSQYDQGINEPLPSAQQLQQPQEPAAAPYFTSWLAPQIIAALQHEGVPAKVAAYRAYFGGLKIRTTLDLSMQQAAQQAVNAEFPPSSNGPTASLVAIDNKTGEVRAMVSGNGNYSTVPFNLATQGHRQPGSSFKPFTLAQALLTGEYGPGSIIDSAPQDFIVPNSGGKEHFIVHNFGNTYSGPISLAEATAISDNSVFSQVGIHVGTRRIARLAVRMGIRSNVSSNYAMILGGLKTGVSALDMAHAYETFATGGLKVYNPTLGDMEAGAGKPGPTGIASITCPVCPVHYVADHPVYKRVIPADVAATVHSMLTAVVGAGGTAPMAAIPGVDVAGKTGTTTNYVDAWFVGWTPQITTAVWVGYPNNSVPMNTNYNGQPVEGGTYPAIIWHSFMTSALQILAAEQAARAQHKPAGTATTVTGSSVATVTGYTPTTPSSTVTGAAQPTTPTTGGTTTPGATGGGTGATGGGGGTGAGAGGGTGATGGGGGTGAGGGTGTPGGGGGTGATGGGGGGSGGAGLGSG